MREEAHRSLGNVIKMPHQGNGFSIPPNNINRQSSPQVMIPNLSIRKTLHAPFANSVLGYICGILFWYVVHPCALGAQEGQTC